MKRDQLVNFINETLQLEEDEDPYFFNGMEVIGKEEVKKIALGVSPDLRLFEKAGRWGADLIILHHGIIGPKLNRPIGRVSKERLKVLFKYDITLLTYHLYLDKHEILGNNAQIIKKLGAKKGKKFGFYEKFYWGWEGLYSKALNISEFIRRIKKLFGNTASVYQYGKKQVKKFAVVSGGGNYIFREAIDKNVDAYLTGEATEWTPSWAKEGKINYFRLGHYNSEKFGVMALGDFLKKKFKELEIKFFEIPNNL